MRCRHLRGRPLHVGRSAGRRPSWRATDLDGSGSDTHLTAISCPSADFCAAVAAGTPSAGGGGRIIAIDDPLTASISTVPTQLDESLNFQGIACVDPGFCVAVADRGRIVASADPGDATPTWREIEAAGAPGNLSAVACSGRTLCLAGNAAGNVLSSTDAASDRPHWREANTGPSVPITGISCATAQRCAAVDNNGDVAVSRSPTGRAESWSTVNLMPFPGGSEGPPLNAFFGVSCPSENLCVAVGSRGMVFTSRNAFAGEAAGPTRNAGSGHPRRPRMRIVRSDRFARQSHTHGRGSKVTFRLRPYGRVRGFVCSLDSGRFRRCRSPLRVYAEVGPHILRARAIGVTGLRGPVARLRFSIRLAIPGGR